VYSVECRATSLSDIGTMDFDVTVRPEKLLEVVDILLGEIKAFAAEGPTEEELAHVKQRTLFDLDVDRDGPYEQIVRYGLTRLYSEPLSPEEEWRRIKAIGRDDLIRLARRLFVREKLNLIVVGPLTGEIRQRLTAAVEAY
jgi:predicted Zn-dependent peptidase